MFVLPDVKVAVLFTPRTGSHTLHNLLWGLCRDRLAPPFSREYDVFFQEPSLDGVHLHLDWFHVSATYRDRYIQDYKAFAFYRHPESWFLSALKYMHGQEPKIFHGNMSPRAFWEAQTNMKRQTSIIASRDQPNNPDGKTIELLNYHNFNTEMIRLFKELEIDLTEDMIDHYTMRNAGYPFDRVLTDKDKAQICKYWWEDYHYLEYRGIELPK